MVETIKNSYPLSINKTEPNTSVLPTTPRGIKLSTLIPIVSAVIFNLFTIDI
jgi:hypothetical protein